MKDGRATASFSGQEQGSLIQVRGVTKDNVFRAMLSLRSQSLSVPGLKAVSESLQFALDYYYTNVGGTLNLLRVSRDLASFFQSMLTPTGR